MANTNIGNNSGIIGDENIIVFNIQASPNQKQVEAEFLKLKPGDFQDITDTVDQSLREKHVQIFSYIKNPLLQLKQQLVKDDFYEHWIPSVPADLPRREKKAHWEFIPIYQGVVFPFSYSFIEMDGGLHLIPLPFVEYNEMEPGILGKIDPDNPIKRCTITQVQYRLGKALTDSTYDYDAMLKRCKIEVV
jgi:hypothetical protein